MDGTDTVKHEMTMCDVKEKKLRVKFRFDEE